MNTQALPVLMYHSVPAAGPGDVLAVPAARVAEQWRALRAQGWELMGLTAGLAAKAASPGRRIVCLTFDDAVDDFAGVPDLLAAHEACATLYVPTAHVGGEAGPLGYDAGRRILTWGQLAALPDAVELGSHGHRHRPQDLLGRRALGRELETSRRAIAERTGRDAVSFCYPHGYASRGTAGTVRAAGFANACVIGHRVARAGRDSAWRLPRLHVKPEHSGGDLVRMVTGGAGPRARVLALAQPPWRGVRRAVHATTGVVLT